MFRLLGVITLGAGFYALYDYGMYLPFISKVLIAGAADSFQVFTVCSSFFLGATALMWMGIRLIALRSFSYTLLYFAVLPLIAWLERPFAVTKIADMDIVLSRSVTYAFLYVLVLSIAIVAHGQWYTPVSHESMRHIGIEKGGVTSHTLLQAIVFCVLLVGLIALHPGDRHTTMRMLFSPFVHVWGLVR